MRGELAIFPVVPFEKCARTIFFYFDLRKRFPEWTLSPSPRSSRPRGRPCTWPATSSSSPRPWSGAASTRSVWNEEGGKRKEERRGTEQTSHGVRAVPLIFLRLLFRVQNALVRCSFCAIRFQHAHKCAPETRKGAKAAGKTSNDWRRKKSDVERPPPLRRAPPFLFPSRTLFPLSPHPSQDTPPEKRKPNNLKKQNRTSTSPSSRLRLQRRTSRPRRSTSRRSSTPSARRRLARRSPTSAASSGRGCGRPRTGW